MKGPGSSAVTFNKVEQDMKGPPAVTEATSTSERISKARQQARKPFIEQLEDIGKQYVYSIQSPFVCLEFGVTIKWVTTIVVRTRHYFTGQSGTWYARSHCCVPFLCLLEAFILISRHMHI